MPTEQQIKAAYKVVRDELREYIDSEELFNTFYAIRTKYNLHVDVAGNLALLIDAIILELVPLTEFPQLLKDILTNSSDSDYQAILKSVNDDVFAVFRTKTKERAEEAKRKADQEAKEDAELEKRLEEEAKMAGSAPAPAQDTSTPVVQPTVTAPAPSIVAQKITSVSAPVQEQSKVVPQESKPAAPPHYHGTDPYREMPE